MIGDKMRDFITVHKDIYPNDPVSVGISSIVHFKDNYIQTTNGGILCKEFFSEIVTLIQKAQNYVV
jgi:hypothetical protein